MADFEIKAGDDDPVLRGTLRDADGNAVDLSSATVTITIQEMRGGDVVVDGEEVTVDQAIDIELFPDTKGTWHYELGDVSLEGNKGYHLEVVATYGDETMQTFPTRGYNTVAVYSRLGETAS